MSSAMVVSKNGKSPLASHYDESFFDEIDRTSTSSAQIVVPIVSEFVSIDSVVDVGCGRGAWLRAFTDSGTRRVAGYDGDYVDPRSLLIPKEWFHPTDLSKPFGIDATYDLALCLEVAEHLPQRCSHSLVSTLCKTSDFVLFSAAIPGQGGTNHINEQWPEYWASIFESHGYDQIDLIRPRILWESGVAPWYKQNTFLYARREVVDQSAILSRERERTASMNVQIVASSRLIPLKSVHGLSHELLNAAARSIRRRLGL